MFAAFLLGGSEIVMIVVAGVFMMLGIFIGVGVLVWGLARQQKKSPPIISAQQQGQ